MTRDQALKRLRDSEAELRRHGVRRAALFGSVARGEARPGSDVDILVELDPEAQVTMYVYVGIVRMIEGLFDGSVDVVNQEGIRPHSRPMIARDAVYAF